MARVIAVMLAPIITKGKIGGSIAVSPRYRDAARVECITKDNLKGLGQLKVPRRKVGGFLERIMALLVMLGPRYNTPISEIVCTGALQAPLQVLHRSKR
jgi:hypothetical protein